MLSIVQASHSDLLREDLSLTLIITLQVYPLNFSSFYLERQSVNTPQLRI